MWNIISNILVLIFHCIQVTTESEYVYVNTPMQYKDAYKWCINYHESLAIITNDDDNESVMESCTSNNGCWIGLNDLDKNGIYEWVDGTAVGSFGNLSPPPNTIDVRGYCIIILPNGSFNVRSCGDVNPFVCQKASSESSEVRASLSNNPTQSPSNVPTNIPSEAPSVSPTVFPTIYPTGYPTVPPIMASLGVFEPTISPSIVYEPTVSPSESPTVPPTMTPTIHPSKSPTISPTISPSIITTILAAENNSTQPSEHPSSTPSITPTIRQMATSFPSNTPTQNNIIQTTSIDTGALQHKKEFVAIDIPVYVIQIGIAVLVFICGFGICSMCYCWIRHRINSTKHTDVMSAPDQDELQLGSRMQVVSRSDVEVESITQNPLHNTNNTYTFNHSDIQYHRNDYSNTVININFNNSIKNDSVNFGHNNIITEIAMASPISQISPISPNTPVTSHISSPISMDKTYKTSIDSDFRISLPTLPKVELNGTLTGNGGETSDDVSDDDSEYPQDGQPSQETNL